MTKPWLDQKETFTTFDARPATGNILPAILKKAHAVAEGDGLHIIQNFEPVPLYAVMGDLGFEHETVEQDGVYHVYFYRLATPESTLPGGRLVQPLGILKLREVDPAIADHTIKIWGQVFENETAALAPKQLYLIHFGICVGAGRAEAATRALLNAYAAGATAAELDDVFRLLIWQKGMAFVDQVANTAVFTLYQRIQKLTKQGKPHEKILNTLQKEFGP